MKFSAMKSGAFRAIATAVGPVMIASYSAHLKAADVTAFPGAEGFGALATGGRGGEILHVANLNDSGPGSLRDAVSKDDRIVVFDVGGYIYLKSGLHVGSDITIAGQSAPGQGIGIGGDYVSLSGSHNVIVRFVRMREGLSASRGKSSLMITAGKDMIFDHVSEGHPSNFRLGDGCLAVAVDDTEATGTFTTISTKTSGHTRAYSSPCHSAAAFRTL